MDNIILAQKLAFNYIKLEVRIHIYEEQKVLNLDETWSLLIHKDTNWKLIKQAIAAKLLLVKERVHIWNT